QHTAHLCNPGRNFKTNWGIVARDNFPPTHGASSGARVLFGGMGGSVGLGHVYLTAKRVELASHASTDADLEKLFPVLTQRKNRLLAAARMERLRRMAVAGVRNEFDAIR